MSIYKALLKLERVTSDMCGMLNAVLRLGLTPKCWCKAISALLEKTKKLPTSIDLD